ncbi:hypothetical protein D3C80_2019420 [compost metagenome]
MTGAPGVTAEADLDLPRQVHQLLAVDRTLLGHGHQYLPAILLCLHTELGAGLAVTDQFAVIAATFRHPELQFVHAGGEDHRTDHPQKDQQ